MDPGGECTILVLSRDTIHCYRLYRLHIALATFKFLGRAYTARAIGALLSVVAATNQGQYGLSFKIRMTP